MLLDVKQKLAIHSTFVERSINPFWPHGKSAATLDILTKTFRSQQRNLQGMVDVSYLSEEIKKAKDK